MGGVAAHVAVLQRGKTTGPAGALTRILEGWHGRAILAVVATGLLCFVVFRFVQVRRAKRVLAAIGYAAGGLGTLALAVSAVRLLAELGSSGDPPPFRRWAAWLFQHAWGGPALATAGAIVALAGAVEASRGVVGWLPPDFVAAVIERRHRKWISRLARFGLVAHGVVVATVGAWICRAGLEANPKELHGTASVLRILRHSSGPAGFGVLAAGLLAYGLSLVLLAAHRRRRLA